jgi:hypothetical protein
MSSSFNPRPSSSKQRIASAKSSSQIPGSRSKNVNTTSKVNKQLSMSNIGPKTLIQKKLYVDQSVAVSEAV